MRGDKNCQSKIQNWKEKAKKRSKINIALRKRLKEIHESRQNWKSKYQALEKKYKSLEREKLRPKIPEEKARAKWHHYPLEVVQLVLWFRIFGGCSLRGCQSILRIFVMFSGLKLSIPSHVSIQNWEKKVGYAQLQKKGKQEEEWVVILDESVSVGQQKVLLILGVCLQDYCFKKALDFERAQVLGIGVGKSWTGDQIRAELVRLNDQGYRFVYGVSDGAKNLVRALRISEIERIEDCTHVLGNLLKKQYKDCNCFKEFSQKCSALHPRVRLSADIVICPPRQRVKGRFLNVQPLAEWGKAMLHLLDKGKLSEKQQGYLDWLPTYRELIGELSAQCETMNKLFKILKVVGLSEKSVEKCEKILKKSKANAFFLTGARTYLETNMAKLPDREKRICCSDIIESYFGKYKKQLAQTSTREITDSCLSLAIFNKKIGPQELKEALEKVKIVDLHQWKKENLPFRIAKHRKKMA